MTTICADAKAGVMCSDSMWFDSEECAPMRKVCRIRGALYGFAGSLRHIGEWVAAIKSGKPPPAKSDVSVMRLTSEGIAVWDSTNHWVDCVSPYAIGSGGKTARGAMAAGASCAQAVRIACTIDATSGGPVRSYRL